MVFLRSLNQGNIGLSCIIWGNLLKFKLMIEFQLIKKVKNYFPSLKNKMKNGH